MEVVLIGLASTALLASLGTTLYAARSRPIVTRQVLDDLINRVHAVERDQRNQSLAWEQYTKSWEGIQEDVEATEERTKRHRRKAQQALGKIQRFEGNGRESDPDSKQALRAKARALGIPV